MRKLGQADNWDWLSRLIDVNEDDLKFFLIKGSFEEGCEMPQIARLVVKGEPAVYHVVSRTALDGFVLGDVEKDFLLDHIRRLGSVYFAEVLGLQ